MAKILEIENLEATAASRQVLHNVNFSVEDKNVLSIIGPLGSGKSSLLRCLNRLYEEKADHSVSGRILFEGNNIFDKSCDLLALRRQISMVFAEPTLFNHLSLFENLALGLRLNNVESGAEIGDAVEKALEKMDLWNELKDQLHRSPEKLSLGQKQLVSLARSMVLKPKVILMDEPTSVVGLHYTSIFEQLIREMSKKITIVMTTSSRKQAARISDRTAFLLGGELIEIGKTSDLFMNPQDNRTEDFLTGRFG